MLLVGVPALPTHEQFPRKMASVLALKLKLPVSTHQIEGPVEVRSLYQHLHIHSQNVLLGAHHTIAENVSCFLLSTI